LFPEALLGRISLQFPYTHISCALTPTSCVLRAQAHIGHALAPTSCVQAQISRVLAPPLYAFLPQAKTPPITTRALYLPSLSGVELAHLQSN